MLRVRFYATEGNPAPVNWPIELPSWCSGYTADDPPQAIVVAYAPDTDYIMRNWPDAVNLDVTEVEKIEFSGRFSKPDWYKGDEYGVVHDG